MKFKSLVVNNIGNVEYQWYFGDGGKSNETNPIYTYRNNGSYVCSLFVKDESGKNSSDSVNISSIQNHKPTVSIETETDKPRRPKNLLLEYILPLLTIHIEFFNSNDYRQLEKTGIFNPIFKNIDSFYIIEASAEDPDGDEIIYYNWTLRPPSYTTRFSGQNFEPEYYYSGKKIYIPAQDIYPAVEYSLTLTVTDSAGEQRSENFQFKVEKSTDRSTFESRMYLITNFINKWVSQWKTSFFIGAAAFFLARTFFRLINNSIPDYLTLPFIKLLVMFFVSTVLQTKPDLYTDESFIDVFKRMVYKDRVIFKNITSEWWKTKADSLEGLLVNLSMFFKEKSWEKLSIFCNNLTIFLQLLEEEIGLDNSRPDILNPYPENNQTFVDLNTKKVFITVNDKEGDPFSVHIFDEKGYIKNSTGYYEMGQHNGSFNASLNQLPPNKEITWKVLVIDQNGKEVEESYRFITSYE